MAASALTTATAAALTSTLPDNGPKSNQQSPRNTATTSTVAVRAGAVEVSKALQDGEKFIKWDEVSAISFFSLDYVVLSHIKGSECFIQAFEPFSMKREKNSLSIKAW